MKSALVVLIVTLAAPSQVIAQQGDTGWLQVRQLTVADSVRVVLDDGAREGMFQIADDESITLTLAGNNQSVRRDSIRRLLVARGSHRKRNVLLGFAIGGVTGGLVVALSCRGEGLGCNEVAPAYFYPFAGAGAGIGALLPARAWRQIFP
jgi:hypothetical protein